MLWIEAVVYRDPVSSGGPTRRRGQPQRRRGARTAHVDLVERIGLRKPVRHHLCDCAESGPDEEAGAG